MQELRFVAVHEDGEHLVLSAPQDGREAGTEYLLAVDERLRAALRQRATGQTGRPGTPISPRAVQALIRAGHTTEEIAAATGWDPARVARFEAPIVAEREHVATRARAAHVRGRASDGGIATLDSRVAERLQARGVEPEDVAWDATRPEGGQWTVVVSFTAANRSRRAAWRYEPVGATVEALDDEARWLSEDEQALPGGREAVLAGDGAGAVDLMATMRERSRARGRRSRKATSGTGGAAGQKGGDTTHGPDGADDPSGTGSADPAALPTDAAPSEDVLPLEDLDYDPATAGLPPAAGRPEADLPAPEGAAGVEGPDIADGTRADEDASSEQPDDPSGLAGEDGSAAGQDDEGAPTTTERFLGRRGRRRRHRKTEEATLADFFGPADEELPSDEPAATGEEDLDEEEVLLADADSVAPDDGDLRDPDVVPADEPVDEAAPLDDVLELPEEPEPAAGGAADQSEDGAAVQLEDDAGEPEAAADEGTPEPEESAEPEPATDETAEPEPAADENAEPEPAADETADPEPAAPDTAPAETTPAEPAPRKKGRKSVPSWDEIMFGAQDRS